MTNSKLQSTQMNKMYPVVSDDRAIKLLIKFSQELEFEQSITSELSWQGERRIWV